MDLQEETRRVRRGEGKGGATASVAVSVAAWSGDVSLRALCAASDDETRGDPREVGFGL